jgi:hypothetical protein
MFDQPVDKRFGQVEGNAASPPEIDAHRSSQRRPLLNEMKTRGARYRERQSHPALKSRTATPKLAEPGVTKS